MKALDEPSKSSKLTKKAERSDGDNPKTTEIKERSPSTIAKKNGRTNRRLIGSQLGRPQKGNQQAASLSNKKAAKGISEAGTPVVSPAGR